MENTLLIGDHVLAQRIPKPTPYRGEIVIFTYPFDRRQTFIKRVIGIGGDRIKIANKQVILNGAPLAEAYAVHTTDYVDSYRDNFPAEPSTVLPDSALEMLRKNSANGELLVPEGKYFVLGDNRDASLDSRYWGFIEANDIIGVPLLVYESEELSSDPNAVLPLRVRWERFLKKVS